MPNLPDLDWQPVLVKVTREPFTGTFCGLQVSRLHLALHADGVVCARWDVPPEQQHDEGRCEAGQRNLCGRANNHPSADLQRAGGNAVLHAR